MPPDSLVQFHGNAADTSLPRAASIPDSVKAATTREIPKPESKTWIDNYYYPVITNLIAALLIFLIARFWKQILDFFSRKKVKLISFSEQTARDIARNFIANGYEILESDSTPVERVESDCMDYFVKKILNDQYSFYFISASTGVGKTTFLLNVYLYYKKKSKGSNSLYCGRAHDPVFRKTIDQLIESGKAGETILLIDALDEFEVKAKSPEDYYRKFESSWDAFKIRLKHFKKVIVSVREQFLQYRSIEKVKIISGTGVSISRQIKLLPFVTEEQREMYLNKRYADRDEAYRENLKWLAFKFDKKGLSFIQLPLVLNFMEDIWTEYQRQKQKVHVDPFENSNFFTLFNLLKIIENAWLQREAKTKGFDGEQIEMIRSFCIELASQIARSGSVTTISGKDLINFEKQRNIIQQFQGAGDRSLLVRKKGITEQDDHYGFVHNYFLELFLIQYVMEQPGKVEDISFVNFQFTIDVITRMQWDKVKRTPPSIPARTDRFLDLTTDQLRIVVEWFDQVYYNDEIKKLLESNHSLLKVIERQDPEFTQYLTMFEDTKIYNGNFWDRKSEVPYPVSVKAVSLLLPFISVIVLNHIPLTDEHLSIFNGISSLRLLDLEDTAVSHQGLLNFQKSASSLVGFNLCYLNLNDESIAIFKESRELYQVKLAGNRLTNASLRYLENSRDSIIGLNLRGNEFDDNGISMFEGKSNIKDLSLGDNSASFDSLLYFRKSIPELERLSLSSINATEEDILSLPDFENLECLFMTSNGFKGICLKKFSKSVKKIERLDLSENQLDDSELESLNGVDKIWALTLSNNPLNGQCLHVFEPCSETLELLDLHNTLIGDEYFINFLHTDKLRHLNLNNLNITGKGLICFKDNYKTLEDLYLSGNTHLLHDSLRVFQSFVNIKRLRLAGLGISHKELEYFYRSKHSLIKLDIRNNPAITDLSFVVTAPNLEVLVLSGSDQYDQKQLAQLEKKSVQLIFDENYEPHFSRQFRFELR